MGTSSHDYPCAIAPGPRRHLDRTLASCRNGRSDPTVILRPGEIVKAVVTADGPSVIRRRELPDGRVAVLGTDGTTTDIRDSEPLFGDSDPGHRVAPVHPAVEKAMASHGAFRIPRTEDAYGALVASILAQRVTAAEALTQWRHMCLALGTAMTVAEQTVWTAPDPDRLRRVPYHELHLLGIDRRRAETLRTVAGHADRLLGGWRQGLPAHERTNTLTLIPGVGVWTAAVTGFAAFCDPDALEIGDYHAKNTVAYALTGRHRGTDAEMIELLRPYDGDRQRVLVWLGMDGWRAPAHGPRRRNVSIARF